LNTGSLPGPAIAVGTDGNLWFVDNGSAQAIGTINPTTHAISEFATGAGTSLGRLAVGPDGNIWFADKGASPAIATFDPTTHAIVRYGTGFAPGSGPSGINTGSDGNVWFTDQGTAFRGMGVAGTGAPPASLTSPSVTGNGNLGAAQSCGGDTWSSWAGQQPSRTAFGFDGYQWLLDGSPIAGATGTSYMPTADQVGHALSCKVTASYALVQVTVSATSSAVTVKGAAEQLEDLTALVAGSAELKKHTRHKLVKELEKAGDALANGDTEKACHRLGKFVKKVEHLKTPKQSSVEERERLLTDATRIRSVLGC
jgi:streptogramin lyase